jgi:CheY-like chemotaxis protein
MENMAKRLLGAEVELTLLPASDLGKVRSDPGHIEQVVRGTLRRGGYTVLEASSPGEALLASEQYGARINLLLTDVVLPRMSGPQLAERLRASRPDMKVMFTSGYTDEAITQHGIIDSGVTFLQKPFTPKSLERKVREALGTRTGSGT